MVTRENKSSLAPNLWSGVFSAVAAGFATRGQQTPDLQSLVLKKPIQNVPE